jgi:glycerophosphoryl diester phosphodiesterase
MEEIQLLLIAHRGASLEKHENSLEGLIYASQIGADIVECDVRSTKDGIYVIFHDSNLSRFIGVNRKLCEITYKDLEKLLNSSGFRLLTLEYLVKNYREQTPILMHIKTDKLNNSFYEIIEIAQTEIIYGVQSVEMLKTIKDIYPSSQILAFIPSPDAYPEFAQNGANIIRLWEHWLCDITPSLVKSKYHDVQVWIMANKNGNMNGCKDSLNTVYRLGADGMLLNDIKLGVRWKKDI